MLDLIVNHRARASRAELHMKSKDDLEAEDLSHRSLLHCQIPKNKNKNKNKNKEWEWVVQPSHTLLQIDVIGWMRLKRPAAAVNHKADATSHACASGE
ncbi:hypothetical protein MMC26_006169 [Xylographa opegraphella]|nr:hypothetical protein [Xylographa opegraphella]